MSIELNGYEASLTYLLANLDFPVKAGYDKSHCFDFDKKSITE